MSQLFFDFYNNKKSFAIDYSDFIINEDNSLAHNTLSQFFNKNFSKHFEKNLILKGEACCGKSHLAKFLASKFIDGLAINFIDKNILENENFLINPLDFFKKNEFFILDDVCQVNNEANLLHLINSANEAESMLILIMREDKIFKLNDLESRLKNFTTTKISTTNIANLKLIFANILSRQQITLDKIIIDYIFDRILPKYAEIVYAVKKIELYCAENGKKISIKNIKEIF